MASVAFLTASMSKRGQRPCLRMNISINGNHGMSIIGNEYPYMATNFQICHCVNAVYL